MSSPRKSDFIFVGGREGGREGVCVLRQELYGTVAPLNGIISASSTLFWSALFTLPASI